MTNIHFMLLRSTSIVCEPVPAWRGSEGDLPYCPYGAYGLHIPQVVLPS
jgi:hypothetical protein